MSDTLASLAADLQRAAAAIVPATRPLIQARAKQMKEDWRSVFPWSGSKHLQTLGSFLAYETWSTASGASAVVGVNKEDQGELGNLIEFGSVNNSPHPGGPVALARAAPVLEAELAALAAALISGGGFSTSSESSVPSRFNARDASRATYVGGGARS